MWTAHERAGESERAATGKAVTAQVELGKPGMHEGCIGRRKAGRRELCGGRDLDQRRRERRHTLIPNVVGREVERPQRRGGGHGQSEHLGALGTEPIEGQRELRERAVRREERGSEQGDPLSSE